MQVCTAKFRVRNQEEQTFVNDMVERVDSVVKQYNLPINCIRFGRQVKTWGKTGVARYHVYRYRNSDKVELWINGHNADLSEEGRKYLEWSAILGCMTWDKINKDVNVSPEDVTAFALKYQYKNNKKLADYLARRVAADIQAGTDFAFIDNDRQAELDARSQ